MNRTVAVAAAAFLFSAASFASEIVSHTVKTNLRDYEQLTLFLMMPPEGQVEGVFCLSLLAKHPDDVRAQLKGTSKRRPVDRALDFARERRFAVVAWGARRLWDPTRNWDELPRSEANRIDARFDKVANAWNAGINFFVKKYGIPPSGYLMMGSSGAAQYAQRLALRRPERFLAVHAHIASSFDIPVKGGASLLWCVTTGENEMGYERSRRFFKAARDLSYPIIYKAYPGLGHEGSAKVTELGFTCFEGWSRGAESVIDNIHYIGHAYLAIAIGITTQVHETEVNAIVIVLYDLIYWFVYCAILRPPVCQSGYSL